MRFRAVRDAGLLTVGLLLAMGPLAAQADEFGDAAATAEPAGASDALKPDEMLLLSKALTFDPAALSLGAPARPLRGPALPQPRRFNLSRTDNPDGSGTVALKQALSAEWNAEVGADLGLAAPPPMTYQPDRPMPGGNTAAPSSAAWASVGVLPNLATLDARVDPGADQGRLGTTLQHSLPIGSRFSVTLRDSYAVTGSFGPGDATAAAAGLPLMARPEPAPNGPAEPVWSNERGVRFNIMPTGTTLSASLASNSADSVTHNLLSAEQRLYGPLRVTTSVSDPGESYSNKSITAGFKLNW